MIKTIALIKRKEGIPPEEFINHYEEVHAPLAIKHLPMIKKYVRNHINSVMVPPSFDFDCISEFWFESIEDAMQVQEFAQSNAGQVLRDDEAEFMDSSKTLPFLVEEKSSNIHDSGKIKAVALLKRKPDLNREAFMNHYESSHAPLIIKHSVGLSQYIRNYIVPMTDEEPPFDSFTEIWYKNYESYKMSIELRLSESRNIIADDEASFLDTSNIAFFLVEEKISNI